MEEITDFLFRSFANQVTSEERQPGPSNQSFYVPHQDTFASLIENMANKNHFYLDPNVKNSILYFYLGAIIMLFRTDVCRRNKVAAGKMFIFTHSIVLTTLHQYKFTLFENF